jgi:hypothetical protein
MHMRPMVPHMDRGTLTYIGVRVQQGTTVGRRGAPARSRARSCVLVEKLFRLACFDHDFLHIFVLKCTKVFIEKL